MTEPQSLLGRLLELDVGAVAHGGHCVARVDNQPGGRVVFVRHALPGERVLARVTEDAGGSFARADAVEILVPSLDRVPAPCPNAGPGRCGGCDWQHARPAAQRELKAHVVREQFSRLAGLEVTVEVAELPGGPLNWRTRIGYAVDADGRPGLRRHRSSVVEPIESCPLGVAGVGDGPELARLWPGEARLELVSDDDGTRSVLAEAAGHRAPPRRPGRSKGRPPRTDHRHQQRLVDGASVQRHVVHGPGGVPVAFEVAPGGFWQVHPAAAQTYADAVLRELSPLPGENALDLYAGAGLFTSVLARALGPGGRVLGLEGDAQAVADAARNLADVPWAEVQRARVDAAAVTRAANDLDRSPELVVLDPPRAGAGAEVIRALLDLEPRIVAYVACDPASLARDVRTARERGWRLRSVSAYDAFPMTHHVECIAVLTPN